MVHSEGDFLFSLLVYFAISSLQTFPKTIVHCSKNDMFIHIRAEAAVNQKMPLGHDKYTISSP